MGEFLQGMHSAHSFGETTTVHELGYEMDTYLDEECETAAVDANMESEPFLAPITSSTTSWVAPKGFIWIEIAIFANVFLSGFDGTITASTYAVISSEFNAANNASWLTTSYLITSTVFQPLYGRFSDIFGRRACFFTSTITFMLGCLGCALAPNIVVLNLMRAVTGLGGGGLMTMGELKALQDSNSLAALCTMT
ncbi:MFS drug transporter [Histoplasma capsulatum H143]|uniref:MFS drug transporter n=1 Tax=Ajellomyces capsulatus (strain H143) TaxID=544712 RepID=C6HLJ2_AJECH|nr:MFS drug transporter [Histoplasma capsulatum H143]